MSAVTLSIDSQSITVPKGTSIIAAAELLGIIIPRFCWHPGLSIAGVCRFCLVQITGSAKLQIACNTECLEGMQVFTQTAEVKEAQKWALEFHLINHPLDCPICDQAGECELQNYYMKVGRYTSQMDDAKVLKPKALDVGSNLILDTERCILCSRCVRFEDEITKTSSLGIFNRGDSSIIGTFADRKINHNYSYNLVDICPVGAFTAKDFRFQCRVWFLKEIKTICPGCSTGCNVTLFAKKKEQTYYRLKPRVNLDINQYWMCDYGRSMYLHLNPEQRLAQPYRFGEQITWQLMLVMLQEMLQEAKNLNTALILTPQYTNEEYELILNNLSFIKQVYVWRDGQEEQEYFDGLLMRGDKNANTQGLMQNLKAKAIEAKVLKTKFDQLIEQNADMIIIFGPEIEQSYTYFHSELEYMLSAPKVIYFGNIKTNLVNKINLTIPTQVFAEKNGNFTNFQGIAQQLCANKPSFPEMLNFAQIFQRLSL